MKKKWLSFGLAAVMVLTMIPVTGMKAYAGDEDSDWFVTNKKTIYAHEIPAGAMVSLEQNATIILDKDLTVETIDAGSYEDGSSYTLTIKDSGGHKLTVKSDELDGINAHTFTMESGTVEVIAGDDNTRGINTEQGDIVIKGGSLKVSASDAGLYAEKGGIRITGGTVDVITTASGSDGIVAKNNKSIAISGAKVTVKADVVGIRSLTNGAISVSDSTLQIDVNKNGIVTGGSLKISNSTVNIKAKVYSLVSGDSALVIDASTLTLAGNPTTVPEFTGYSPKPSIVYGESLDGSVVNEWTGTPALDSVRIRYLEIRKPGDTTPTAVTDAVSLTYAVPAAGNKQDASVKCSGATVTSAIWYQKIMTERGIVDWEAMKANRTFGAGGEYMIRIRLKPVTGRKFALGTKMKVYLNGIPEPLIIKELTETSMIIEMKYTLPEGLKNPFVDVYKTDAYYDAVLWAYYADPQITNGIDETHFGPKKTVTRGQCAAFLWRAMGCPEPTSTYNPFVDVPDWQYYYKPILWAVENGITKGTDATHFSPDLELTTAHIITFLYRTKNTGKDGWYQEAANWAVEGYGGKPFGVDTVVNDMTYCPRAYVVMFLQKAK